MATRLLPLDMSDEELVEIVRTGRSLQGVPLARAMAALRLRRTEVKREVFQSVLADPRRPPRLRHVAAMGLYQLGDRRAERALVDLVERVEPQTAATIAMALGRIGSADALPVARRLARLSGPARERAAFGAALLAYRHRLEGDEVSAPAADALLQMDGGQATLPIGVDQAGGLAQRALAALEQDPVDLRLTPERAVRVACGPSELVFTWNAPYDRGDLRGLLERKDVAGAAFRKSPIDDSYSLALLVLATPREAGREVGITVHRATGAVVYAGTLHVGEREHELELHAVRRPGANAITLTGALRDGALHAERAVSSSEDTLPARVPRRAPAPG